MRKFLVAASLAVLPAAALVGQASAAKARPTATAPNVVHITASKSGLKYMQTVVHARAGRIKIIFTNPSALQHDVKIEVGESEAGGTKSIAKGTTTAYATLKAGTYKFYCSVPGHEAAGMTGTLIVS